MIRDPGPISSLGYGITTRDIPNSGDEREGISANSGFISKALNDHPIAKFLASTAGLVASTMVLSKMVKSGGLKLGKYIQDVAETAGQQTVRGRVASRFIEDALSLRKYLDELEGYARYVGGPENEGKLVFTRDGVLTTGYDSIVSTSFDSGSSRTSWFAYKTKDEINNAAKGITGESAASYTWRDQLQRGLVRSARQMPYILPAMYGAQKAVVEPLFTGKQDDRKFKWYNPADVISDFTATSLKNIATMILPFEAAGATAKASKSSLNSLFYAQQEMNSILPGSFKGKMHKGFIDISELLAEVGHDAGKLFNKASQFATQAGRGLTAGTMSFKNDAGFTINAHKLRHGIENALKTENKRAAAKDYLKNLKFDDVVSKIPSYTRFQSSIKAGINEYKLTGAAYETLQQGSTFDEVLRNLGGLVSRSQLDDAVKKIQSLQGTGLSRSLKSLAIFGGKDGNFRQSQIYSEVEIEEYKQLIFNELKKRSANSNITDEELKLFVSNLKVSQLPKITGKRITNPTETISIGKNRIFAGTDEEYFEQVIKDYTGTSGRYLQNTPFLKRFFKKGRQAQAQGNPLNISASDLNSAIGNAGRAFTSDAVQQRIKATATSRFNAFIRQSAPNYLASSLKGEKLSFKDYYSYTEDKKLFLQKKVAETLKIPLVEKSTGVSTVGQSFIGQSQIESALRARGIDPNDYGNLVRFLIANKKMTAGVMPTGLGILGLQPLTVRQAEDEGIISRAFPNKMPSAVPGMEVSREEQLLRTVSNFQVLDDPLRGIQDKLVKGAYKTSGGEVIDISTFTEGIRRLGRFAANELKFPVLGFNPADLFGYQSFKSMADTSNIQYISNFSVQPFAKGVIPEDSAYQIFYKTKPTKGRLVSFSADVKPVATELAGEYRPVVTDSTTMMTRSARIASGLQGVRPYQISGDSGSPMLDKILGKDRAIAIKDRLSISADQPNSLFGFAARFINRNIDINNPKIIAGLLSEEGTEIAVGGKKILARIQKISQQGKETLQVVNKETGEVLLGKSGAPLFSETQILRSVDLLHSRLGNYAQPINVIKAAEQADKDLFTLSGGSLRVSEISSESSLMNTIKVLEGALQNMGSSRTVDPVALSQLRKAFSRVQERAMSIDFNALAQGAEKSSVKTTQFDEIKNELFNFVTSYNAVAKNVPINSVSSKLVQIADDLYVNGAISASQKAESQLATLFDMTNNAAFATYDPAKSVIKNARARVEGLIGNLSEAKAAAEPLTSGTEAYIGGGAKTLIKPLLPGIRRRLGSAPFAGSESGIDPLGSGQRITLVPTFKTAIDKAGLPRALASAAGITTYRDPEAYSFGSFPVQHGVQRLDKYFTSVGTGFDAADFSGPLSMFASGMVGKRVLPAYLAGTTALTIDRTLGGATGDVDDQERPVYKPLLTTAISRGIVELQSVASGLTPGGMSYKEKKEQLLEGEVPIRQGRYWPLGNTKFTGGKIMYYRPSWYRRLQAGALFTEDTYGSPVEKFLFYNDTSPLRPLDPYRFERKHYEDRPYPLTGEYFTGPFGPLTSLANATFGRLIKPQIRMHEDEVNRGLSQYAPVGSSGAYNAAAYGTGGAPTEVVNISSPTGDRIATEVSPNNYVSGPESIPVITPEDSAQQQFSNVRSGNPVYIQGPATGSSPVSQQNRMLAARAGSTQEAGKNVRKFLGQTNAQYAMSKPSPQYGPPKVSGVMPPRIVPVGEPINTGSVKYQAGELGYRAQEMAGIYGFGIASLRESMGLGNKDVEPDKSVLQSAAKAYGTTRAFWDLNLGGLGDIPLPSQDAISNIEFSEITRRFIPKERSGVDFINPIKNKMGKEHPFLPGPEYFIDFTSGDPYTKIQEGELRLPGIGYERLNKMYPDQSGKYGVVNKFDILADVAPYSKEYRSLDKSIDKMDLSEEEQRKVAQIRAQVANTTKRYEFSDYKFIGKSFGESGGGIARNIIGRTGEYIAHRDNFIINKTIGKRTAVEDWERSNVYGTTFPEWQRPVESYITPMVNRATQRSPVTAGLALGIFGGLVGVGSRGRLISSAIGAAVGVGASIYGNVREELTGTRYIPLRRKKELALEEYSDIMSYVKNKRLENISRQQGDAGEANKYRMAAQRTMYGAPVADIGTGKYGTDIESLSLAIPKRKREHFKAMINAPEDQRERILSTSGRLERRIYQAAWGAKIEKKPDLVQYFRDHELPDSSWEGWHPNTNMENVKIKMAQSMGLELSEMGYYPQQIKEANLINPSYPDFLKGYQGDRPSEQEITQRLDQLMQRHGVTGHVRRRTTSFGNQKINITSGIQ